MSVKVGTFNLNNLFSRFDFAAEVGSIAAPIDTAGGGKAYEVVQSEEGVWYRTYMGKLVKGKGPKEQERLAARILAEKADVLAVQEVENIDALREFNTRHLNGYYHDLCLIEGNDPRLIDVAVMSNLPLGPITSHKFVLDPANPGEWIFGRDLLEVDVLEAAGAKRVMTLYVNHLKSQLIAWDAPDKELAKQECDDRRTRQAKAVFDIVAANAKTKSEFVILGDMNDGWDSACLAPFVNCDLGLTDGLKSATETTHLAQTPSSAHWTYRHKEANHDAQYLLYDQIWLSPPLQASLISAHVNRRQALTGTGSDHDMAVVELDL
jgi:predicted extracellular nuclease